MPRNSPRTNKLFEALPKPEIAFNTSYWENKKHKQQQQNPDKQIEIEMVDIDNNNNKTIRVIQSTEG